VLQDARSSKYNIEEIDEALDEYLR